jgi:hypothetical protein
MKGIPYFIFLFVCSCTVSSEKVSDPLAMFPVNDEWEFLSSLGKDGIIMLLKRTEENKFTYRIEFMKNYYGLPLDYGTVSLKQIEKDSSLSFEGGNAECRLKLKMYQSKEKNGGKRVILERTCSDTTKNISRSHFEPLWRRGEAHSKK